MSWVGATTGLPSAGDSRLAVDSIIVRASSWAAVDSGTWTAIWSPSKSALKAVQTSGWIWMAEEVLAEPALLALQHVAERLQPMVAGAGDRPAAAAVVDQRVARLLEHPLLVADDDLRRPELEEPLEPVVAVDDAAIQVVEVGRGEAAAV